MDHNKLHIEHWIVDKTSYCIIDIAEVSQVAPSGRASSAIVAWPIL